MSKEQSSPNEDSYSDQSDNLEPTESIGLTPDSRGNRSEKWLSAYEHRNGAPLGGDSPESANASENSRQGFDEIMGLEGSSSSSTKGSKLDKPQKTGNDKGNASKEGRGKKIAFISLAVILVLIGGFFGARAIDGYFERQAQEQETQEQEEQEAKRQEAISAAENPFSVAIGEVDEPGEGPLEISVEEDELRVGAESLSISDVALRSPLNDCSLEASTDICLGSRAEVNDGPDFDILVAKDISRSRFLDDPIDFAEIERTDNSTAAVLTVDMGSEEPALIGALTANGNTGYLFLFPEDAELQDAQEIISSTRIL